MIGEKRGYLERIGEKGLPEADGRQQIQMIRHANFKNLQENQNSKIENRAATLNCNAIAPTLSHQISDRGGREGGREGGGGGRREEGGGRRGRRERKEGEVGRQRWETERRKETGGKTGGEDIRGER